MKKKAIYSHKCDWCNRELILNGSDSDSYVVTAAYQYFCIIQSPSQPAERDCMRDYLNNINGIKLNPKSDNYKNVYWVICIELLNFSENERDTLMAKLNEKHIDSRPYFYPISEMPMYSSVYTPVTKLISKRGINLPSYYDITQDQVLYICKELKKLL